MYLKCYTNSHILIIYGIGVPEHGLFLDVSDGNLYSNTINITKYT